MKLNCLIRRLMGAVILVSCLARAQSGPLLSDAALLDALNLDYPGLEQVQADLAQGDTPAAVDSLADYLRSRTNVTWFFDPHAVTNTLSYNSALAISSATGTITVSSIPYTFPDGDIDWFYNPTTAPGSLYPPNNEWQWQLNRMYWWPNLGNTYWGRSGDEYYAQAWVTQLRDWIHDCPAQSSRKNVAGSAWRTIETGLRMSTYWPDTYHRFLGSPSMSPADFALYLKSCVEQARYLRAFSTQANFLTMEMAGLYTVGALFPELDEAAEWRSFAAQKLQDEQTIQFLPDGWHIELAPGYHIVAIDNILKIYYLAELQGITGELSAEYLTGLEKTYEALLYMSAPDRNAPPVNDAGRSKVQARLAEGYAFFTNRLDFLWLATDGAQGRLPAQSSYSFPYGGFNMMRSGWEREANLCVLDAGPLGSSSHRHEDKLALQLWAYGREILFDHGAGEYETSIWRTYSMSSYGHNTVVVDGLSQRGGDGNSTPPDNDYVSTAPRPMRWASDITHDFASGVFDRGYGSYNNRPATHTRRVLFVKPDLYLVADTLQPADSAVHTYQARWNLLPVNSVLDAVTETVTTADAGQPNLSIVPCLRNGLAVERVVARESTDVAELLGWRVQKGTTSHVPCTTLTHTRSGTGAQQFLTLLMPLRAGESNQVAEVTATGATSAEIRLSDGRRLLVSADPDPARGLRLTELSAAGTTNRIAGAGFVPPALANPGDLVMRRDSTLVIELAVSDADSDAGALRLTATSSDTALLPQTGIGIVGGGATRSVSFTPTPGMTGQAVVILTLTDPDGSTTAVDFRLIVDAPPKLTGRVVETEEESPVLIDLRTLTTDDLTPSSALLFAVSGSSDGTVTLLEDGYTARFTPALNLTGTLTFNYSARDRAPDPRLLLAYDFETGLTGSTVADFSGNGRDGTLDAIGSGVYALSESRPELLSGCTRYSLLLDERGDFNGARVRRQVTTAELNLSDHSWSFSGWFNRKATADDDFIFYIGRGDGFGSNEELQLHGVRGKAELALRHFVGESTTDFDIVAGGVATGLWHHVAVTFERTAPQRGVITLYLNGTPVGSDSDLLFTLDQSVPITFGGNHSATFETKRWFNGALDELALFNAALTPPEVAALAVQSIGQFGGQTAELEAAVQVRDINDAPSAAPGRGALRMNESLTVDLRSLAADVETPAAGLRFELAGAQQGTALLQADGHTVLFTPHPGFSGTAAFNYTVTDLALPSGLLLHCDFEEPGAAFRDLSHHSHDPAVVVAGTGEWSISGSVPPLIAGDSLSALQLRELGDNNGASLQCSIAEETLSFSDHDWSFSAWVWRTSKVNDDFIFYIGKGDGFGANEELQLYGAGGTDTLRLRHYIGEGTTDADLSVAGFISQGWHHVALTFTRSAVRSGTVRLYLNGVLKATDSSVYLTLDQSVPLVLGGHYSESVRVSRWFNGALDDTALFSRALTSAEVTRLATRTLRRFGGVTAGNTVTLQVLAPEDTPLLYAPLNSGGSWSMLINGPSGFGYTVESSTNLIQWAPLEFLDSPALPLLWSDPEATLHPRRFYRVRLQP